MNRHTFGRVVATCTIFGFGVTGCAPQGSPQVAIAQGFTTKLLSGDASSLEPLETDTVRQGLTAGTVNQLVQTLTKQEGQFKSMGATRTGKVSGFDVVYVTCAFDRGSLDAKVVFDATNKVAGFFFVPVGGT